MTKIRLEISYDGTHFSGWQRQTQGQRTIQAEVEKAASQIFGEEIKVVGSGRTDAKVHALSQTAHFSTSKDPKRYSLKRALNSQLPNEIVVRQAFEAPEEFHALFSARQKTYKYLILLSEQPSALRRNYVHWLNRPLDLRHLNNLCEVLIGTHDFKSFQSAGTEIESTVRSIFTAQFRKIEPHLVEFRITGNGFLKQMVRNIVGTLLYLEKRGEKPEALKSIMDALERQAAKNTAPPQGLYLCHVKYPPDLDKKCRKI